MEVSQAAQCRSVSRQYPYAGGNTPKDKLIKFYGVPLCKASHKYLKGKSSVIIYQKWGNIKY